MSAEGFRHELTKEQKRMREADLIASLPEGTVFTILQAGPYDVAVTRTGQWIVLDCSTPAGFKPSKVYEGTKLDCIAWARASWQVLRMTHHQMPEWSWE